MMLRDALALSLVAVVAVFIALCVTIGTGCYKCVDPQCSNLPPVDPNYPPEPPFRARDAGRDAR